MFKKNYSNKHSKIWLVILTLSMLNYYFIPLHSRRFMTSFYAIGALTINVNDCKIYDENKEVHVLLIPDFNFVLFEDLYAETASTSNKSESLH